MQDAKAEQSWLRGGCHGDPGTLHSRGYAAPAVGQARKAAPRESKRPCARRTRAARPRPERSGHPQPKQAQRGRCLARAGGAARGRALSSRCEWVTRLRVCEALCDAACCGGGVLGREPHRDAACHRCHAAKRSAVLRTMRSVACRRWLVLRSAQTNATMAAPLSAASRTAPGLLSPVPPGQYGRSGGPRGTAAQGGGQGGRGHAEAPAPIGNGRQRVGCCGSSANCSASKPRRRWANGARALRAPSPPRSDHPARTRCDPSGLGCRRQDGRR